MSKTPILFYQVVPGELTVVTGVPNSGKSEWIDALICNLNESSGWKFALCSMENQVSSICHQSVIFFRLGSLASYLSKGQIELNRSH